MSCIQDFDKISTLTHENTRLLSAIRNHRDQRGDDRCWMDDEELYKALPEGYAPPARDTAVELENCKRFIACRQNPATEYVSPEKEISGLKALVRDLAVQLNGYHSLIHSSTHYGKCEIQDLIRRAEEASK